MAKDYYELLGVSKNASKDEIKKAFHKMAHTYHPDKKGGDAEKFKEINQAYQTLSDDGKRAQYDQFGADGPQMGGFGGGQGGGFGGFDFGGFSQGQGTGGFEFDLGDMFGEMFGGGSRKRGKPRGQDLQTTISLSFKEAIFGVEKEITVKKPSFCTTCEGTGGAKGTKMETCSTCSGSGTIRSVQRTILGNIATTSVCTTCFGAGSIPKEKCSSCRGSGVVNESRTLKVTIPAGVSHGETLRVTGMGEAVRGGTAGDLYVRLTVASHKSITREGNDLVSNLHIKLSDALLGAAYDIETLDGVERVEVPAHAKIGSSVVLKEKGVPVSKSKRGNFTVRLHIVMPEKLSKEAKKLIEELKKEGL
jgi:molecular chaperone DnaJ